MICMHNVLNTRALFDLYYIINRCSSPSVLPSIISSGMPLDTATIANFSSFITGLWSSGLLENGDVFLSYSSLRKLS